MPTITPAYMSAVSLVLIIGGLLSVRIGCPRGSLSVADDVIRAIDGTILCMRQVFEDEPLYLFSFHNNWFYFIDKFNDLIFGDKSLLCSCVVVVVSKQIEKILESIVKTHLQNDDGYNAKGYAE